MVEPPVSVKTVEYLRAKIKQKLGIDTNANVATTDITRQALKYFPDLLDDKHPDYNFEPGEDIYHTLTPQQLAVWKLTVKGYDRFEVAKILGISHKTVEYHRLKLMQKLKVNNAADLTSLAVKLGIVEPAFKREK